MNKLEKLEREIMDFVDKKEKEYEKLYSKTNPTKYSEVFANARFTYLCSNKSMRKMLDERY